MPPKFRLPWTVFRRKMVPMGLVDDVGVLRERMLAELNAAHDYYTDTKIPWDSMRQLIAAGNTFSVRNMVTGTVRTHGELASKAHGYVAVQLAEATFQQFISIFENWLFSLLRLWLIAYPRSLLEAGRLQNCLGGTR